MADMPPSVALLTLREAVEVTGKSMRTLRRWVSEAKIPSQKDSEGRTVLEVEELKRRGLLRAIPGGTPAIRAEGDTDTSAMMAGLRSRVADLEGQLADVKQDRDQWRDQAQTLARALPPAPQPTKKPHQRRWWPWRR